MDARKPSLVARPELLGYHGGDMFRVAVVGTGYWGPNLARNLYELGVLDVVCDLRPERAEALAARFGVRAETDYEAILADPAIGAVVLATPVNTHRDLAQRALNAGKHVFVEKPLALDSAGAEALCRRAEEVGRVLMVGHILEYHPAFLALRDRVAAGDLGRILHIRSTRLNLGKLRTEENVLWSFAPHDLSLVLRLAGAEPGRIRAMGHRLLGTPREDTVYADLAFENGLTAHVLVSWLEPIKQHQFVVVGDRKMAVFDDLREAGKLRIFDRGFDPDPGLGGNPNARLDARPHARDANSPALLDGTLGARPDAPPQERLDAGTGKGTGFVLRDRGEEIVELPPVEPMKAELEDFLRSCRNGGRPLADGWSGLRVVQTLERISRALADARAAEVRP